MEFSEIKGFGAKRILKLKEYGVRSVNDLLTIFPYRYIDLSNLALPSQAETEQTITVLANVSQPPTVQYLRKGLFLTKVQMRTQKKEGAEAGEDFFCSWFNQKYLKNRLAMGKQFYVVGSVDKYGKTYTIKNPTLIDYSPDLPNVYPLYRPIKGIPSSLLISAIDTVLSHVTIKSYINPQLRAEYGLAELNEAFRNLHKPKTIADIEKARKCLAIENLSCNMALYSMVKQIGIKRFRYKDKREELFAFANQLPFMLTLDQKSALTDILNDLDGDKKMNRLLQGDVGCGKTIVALLGMYYAALSGLQSVLMSPTELLARQHLATATKLFSGQHVTIAYLSSALNAAQRQEALRLIESGEASIVIGTHSLIQDSVVFHNLSLIITDEQQRFGVKQRGALENKAQNADYLVMTATPIPRTLALTLYGDLDQSSIKTVPAKKAKITTGYVPHRKMGDMWEYVLKKAEAGEQTYIVCPRIENEEMVSVDKLHDELVKSPLKPFLGRLHGQQSDEEKSKIMAAFATGKVKVLVTTSIVEVGIDVPQATTIIIFHAERYGLSQLHQLRGRVGRGDKDSFCFVLTEALPNEKTKERVDYFINCNDGFALAEFDFRARGAGDFMGTRQHGDSFLTEINKPLIDTAKKISSHLLANESLREKLLSDTNEGNMIFIEKLTMN